MNAPRSVFTALALVALAAATVAPASAAPVVFDTPPFAGSSANPDDGIRTIFGGQERFLASFDLATDRFVFNPGAFGISTLSFFSGLAADLPTGGANLIVLQTTDNDGNPATPFGAGTAANLIAAAVEEDGAGFFVYHNSVLGVNRLVFSTNLNSNTADLAILARITSPTGAAAIEHLQQFSTDNFAVPEPAALALAMTGLLATAGLRRRPRRKPCLQSPSCA